MDSECSHTLVCSSSLLDVVTLASNLGELLPGECRDESHSYFRELSYIWKKQNSERGGHWPEVTQQVNMWVWM